MTKTNNIILLIIIALFGVSVWMVLPDTDIFGRKDMQLGLDLQGGVQLVYEVKFADNATAADQKALMDGAILKIGQRIDQFGVMEPVVQQVGADRILIQLPGFTAIESAKSLVQQTGFLEFRVAEKNISGTIITLGDYLKQDNNYQFIDAAETGSRLFTISNSDATSSNPFKTVGILTKDNGVYTMTDVNGNPADNTTLSQYSSATSWIPARGDDGTALTGEKLADAQAIFDTSSGISEAAVHIEWNSEGSDTFDQIAARIHNPQGTSGTYALQYVIGIFLDNDLISAPQIVQASYEGTGQISGSFTAKEAETLATLLKSGSLPMPIGTPIFEDKVSATLGAEFVDKSILAGIIGLALVIFFMIAYYRLPGLMASLALIFYGTLTLAIFKLWPVTLSLGGIGGFIVSMGIAVDANVLIFERLKEEYRMGRTLGASIEAGFHRAWSAIWDSNMTTFIACIILYWLGTTAMHNAAVTGFAVTLFIGAIVSMFTAVLVTRTLLRATAGTGLANKPVLFTVTGGKK